MTSSAQRGAYYKARTKRWLEAKGYQVADLERVHWIFRQGQPALATKRDQFGSDLLAVSARSIIFVQCKGGGAVTQGNFPDARRKFAQYQFPPWTRQWVIAWPARSRAPRIVDVRKGIDGRPESCRVESGGNAGDASSVERVVRLEGAGARS